MARAICLSVILICAGSVALGQTQREFWPEANVFVPLKPKVRLMFSATITRVEETRNNTEGQVGAHIDFLAHKKMSFRAGYRYGFALAGGDPFQEHRIVLEQTFRQNLPFKVLVSDRNREDLRFVNGDFSVRYRNRITLEREFELRRIHITPYVSAEAYYDSRFDTWNRNRLTAGIQIPLKRGFPVINRVRPTKLTVLDVYLMRQNDSRSSPARVSGIGVALNLHL